MHVTDHRELRLNRAGLVATISTVLLTYGVCAGAAAELSDGTSSVTTEVQWNRDLLRSGRIDQVAESMKAANSNAAAAADNSAVERVRSSLPSLDQLSASLKHGAFVAVSPHGAEVITLLRQMPMRKGKDRSELLEKILRFTQQGVPEAQNFTGFVYENALFGAPRDVGSARKLYEAAAAKRYQPALLNLANLAYFGRGEPRNLERARELLRQAGTIATESSGRVCGLASFIEYRRGDRDAALRLSKFCYSPLANIPKAAYDDEMPLARRIKLLRDSIETGAPDGYRWLEVVSQQAASDKHYSHCKYRLVNQLRENPRRGDLAVQAKKCYSNVGTASANSDGDGPIRAILSSAVQEARALEDLRRKDRFRQAWSVPYLPFGQIDVDLYASVIKESR